LAEEPSQAMAAGSGKLSAIFGVSYGFLSPNKSDRAYHYLPGLIFYRRHESGQFAASLSSIIIHNEL
jgi:hypothetical protein